MDGFGRPWRSTAKGPAAGQDITADTAYNARGNVASQTAPYYAGDPVYTTTKFAYDALDRPIDLRRSSRRQLGRDRLWRRG